MSNRKSRTAIALVWALVPLTVFGSLPRMGCICANGEHKFFCERHRSRDGEGRCVCCHGPAATGGSSGEKTCCRQKRAKGPSELPVVSSTRPCRPVLDQPLLLAAARSILDLDQAAHTPLCIAAAPLPTIDPCTTADATRAELLPPPDLVTTLGVLLI